MSDWQPIETAPGGVRVRVAHELDPSSMKVDSRFKTTGEREEDGRWACSSAFVCVDNFLRWNPTHWRPIEQVSA